MTTRKVPEEDIERIRELTGSYRRFKKTKRELKQVQQDLLETITTLESTINEQTRKPLSYLALASKTVSSPEKTVRKSSSETKSGA